MSWLPVSFSDRPSLRLFALGVFFGLSLSISSTSIAYYFQTRKRERQATRFILDSRPIELRSDEVLPGVTGLIGNTPLIRINSLSDALGIEILGKAEFLNPGGSVKDRVALRMIDDAEQQGLLHPHTGSRIFEGTVGSTGISISTIARARGYDTTIIMPDDVAEEKVKALKALGADVERVRPASVVDKKQYVNIAKERARAFGRASASGLPHIVASTSSVMVTSTSPSDAAQDQEEFIHGPRGFFADQFENRSNYLAHFDTTGPEIWRQTNGRVTAFVSGAGTGGTIAGIGRFLKSVDENVLVALSDPVGSGLYNKVKHGVLFDQKEREGTKRRHQVDTVVEGIGLNRITNNLEIALAIIDDAFRVTDAEAVAMSRYLVKHDGLFLGSSSACNLIAAIKLAKSRGWKNREVIVTILCDSGSRHYSKFWNEDYLAKAEIPVDIGIVERLLQEPPQNVDA